MAPDHNLACGSWNILGGTGYLVIGGLTQCDADALFVRFVAALLRSLSAAQHTLNTLGSNRASSSNEFLNERMTLREVSSRTWADWLWELFVHGRVGPPGLCLGSS